MKLASYFATGLAVAAGLALSTAAQAQDGALMSSNDLYFNGTIGGSALIFSGSSNVAKTYYGVDASGEVCRANSGGFDLCGGLNVFHTFSNGKKTTGALTTSTRVASVGGFIKARKQMDQVGIAPYAGLRRFFTQTTATGVGAATKLTDNANAVFGGIEVDYNLVPDRVYVSMKAEIGRTFGAQTNRTTFLLSPGLKVKF